jgi:hypothetical protein
MEEDIKNEKAESGSGDAGKQPSSSGQGSPQDLSNPRIILNQVEKDNPLDKKDVLTQNQEKGETQSRDSLSEKSKANADELVSDAMQKLDDLIRKIKDKSKSVE